MVPGVPSGDRVETGDKHRDVSDSLLQRRLRVTDNN